MKKPVPFGKYLLLERINVGGMAEVFKAKAFGVEGFERLVAVKRILPSIAEDTEFITMFIDEAKIAVQLSHANIAQIFDLGRVGEAYFIALEYVAGRDLRTIWDRARKKRETLPVPMACYATMKVCEGLDYAHNKKDSAGRPLHLVHRDVSPQNILISWDGEAKIIDFGVAKAAGKAGRTQAGILKGKFGYMSPEQVRGLPLDRRGDVFACGIVLYELLTGERLFAGENELSTLEKVRSADIPAPSRIKADLPHELEQIVLKALARDPDDRYQTAIDLHDDLQSFMYTSGNFFARKDLAVYMKKAFAEDIGRELEKDEEYSRLPRPPMVTEYKSDHPPDRGSYGRDRDVVGAHGDDATRPPGGSKRAPASSDFTVPVDGNEGTPVVRADMSSERPPGTLPVSQGSGPNPVQWDEDEELSTSVYDRAINSRVMAAAQPGRASSQAPNGSASGKPSTGKASGTAQVVPSTEVHGGSGDLNSTMEPSPAGRRSGSESPKSRGGDSQAPARSSVAPPLPALGAGPRPPSNPPALPPSASPSGSPRPSVGAGTAAAAATMTGVGAGDLSLPPVASRPPPPPPPASLPSLKPTLGGLAGLSPGSTLQGAGSVPPAPPPRQSHAPNSGATLGGLGAATINIPIASLPPQARQSTRPEPLPPSGAFVKPPPQPQKKPYPVLPIAIGAAVAVLAAIVAIWSSRQSTASLRIQTDPADIEVFVDEKRVSRSGSQFVTVNELSADEDHFIEFRKAGYQGQIQKVNLSSNEQRTIGPITLKPSVAESNAGFSISSNPPGASIVIDGVPHPNRTPTIVSGLAPGPHTVQISAGPAYRTWQARVDLQPGQVATVPEVRLETASIRVSFASEPRGAQVTLTRGSVRQNIGVAPATVDLRENVPPWTVEMTLRGYETASRTVETAPGQSTLEMNVPLTKRGRQTGTTQVRTNTNTNTNTNNNTNTAGGTGTLRVNSRPWSTVSVDGRRIGNTPQMNIQLPAGRHTVVLENPEFRIRETFPVTIRAGQVTIEQRQLNPQ